MGGLRLKDTLRDTTLRSLVTPISSLLAASAGAFFGKWAWSTLDPVGVIAVEGPVYSFPINAWIIDAFAVLPFYIPWIFGVTFVDQRLRSGCAVTVRFAVTIGFVIAAVGQLRPFDFIGHLDGYPAYFATMLLTSSGLISASCLRLNQRQI